LKLGAWFLKIAFIISFLVLTARPVDASPVQVGATGSITGQVVDPSGAVVPGATVTVTNDSSKQSVTVTTDAMGNFTINRFPVGLASIKVTASGFQIAQAKGLTISVGQALTQHIVLPVGAEVMMAVDNTALGGAVAPEGNAGGTPNQAGGAQTQGTATQQQHSQGQQLTGSAWGTPDACATGTAGALAAKGILFVHRSLVLPQEASDDFGYRLGKRYCRRPQTDPNHLKGSAVAD